MKKNLLKTLLIIAALAMGTSAWGQVTTAFTQDFTAQGESTNPSDYGFTCVTESSDYSTTSVIEGVLKNVSGGHEKSKGAEYVADFKKIESGNVVNVTFRWITGNATGNKTQSYSETYIADENGNRVFSIRYLGQNRYLNVNGVLVATSVARNSTFDVSAKVNLTTKMIDSLSVGNAYTKTNIYFESAEAENISRFGFRHYARASSWTNTSSIDDVSITYEAEKNSCIEVTVSAAGLATYCPPVAVDFSSASKVAAYKAVVSGTTVNLTKVTSAAAGEGVLLRSVGGGATSETLPVLATATKAEDNAFVGTLSDINVLEDDGTNINYVLSKEGNEVGFYKAAVAGTKVGAGKAYLPVAKSDAAKGMTFVYSDNATGISEIATDVNRTADGAIYSLSGVRVQNPSKGLYIMNGKKVIVK